MGISSVLFHRDVRFIALLGWDGLSYISRLSTVNPLSPVPLPEVLI